MKKALIAMSGGVDSSVAAYLTQKLGYDCIGCTMKLYNNEDAGIPKEHTCCSLDDVEDARNVALRLGMPYYVFNFSDDFNEKVIQKFICYYRQAMTPNPCIDCNKYMKFDKLFDRAKIMGCDKVVTGHYARIEETPEGFVLKKALDLTKDQSYVLYQMNQEQLAHTLFPLGSMAKTETRAVADEMGFLNADKPDSQDICFVPDGDYAKVIEQITGETSEPGDFVLTDGTVVGRHKGIIHYTIGQRKGLGIAWTSPLYVLKLDTEKNQVVLGSNEDLFGTEVDVKEMHWISGQVPTGPFTCKAKLRYRHTEQPATVTIESDETIHLSFEEPQRAITPGQSAVLYDGDVVLGGGIIYFK